MKKILARTFLLSVLSALIMLMVSIPKLSYFEKANESELNVFVWGAYLSPETISRFEENTGIKVHLHLCSANEEMLSKVRASKPGAFDLVFASDYAIPILKSEDAIKKIDKSKLNFLNRISPLVTGHSFDPKNEYCIPYSWEVYGIAENTRLIKPAKTPSLDQIYATADNKVAMIPEPVEAFTTAAYYLYKKTGQLNRSQIDQTYKLLKKQRKWVEAYADFRAKYLVATENCPIALVKSSFLPNLAQDSPEISYRIPKEATFTSIEHAVIPKGATNEKGAYEFMNHIFAKEEYHETYKCCAVFPTCLDAIEGSLLDVEEIRTLIKEIKKRDDIVTYDYIMDPSELREKWISIKS